MTPRKMLFRIVAAISAVLLYSNEWLTNRLAASFIAVNRYIRKFFAAISLWIMQKLDPETMKSYELSQELLSRTAIPSETRIQNTELKLLEAGYKVRNHARDTGEWSDDHSEALNAIGDALLNECSWPEPKVHEKLKEIVESIEGLQYGPD